MSSPVYVTRRIPDEGLRLLRKAFGRVDVNPRDRPLSRGELLRAARGRRAVITQLVDRIDGEFFAAARGVEVVANYAVGHDNIDLAAARRAGVVVTNTPGVLTRATAELTWALILAAARRVAEADRLTRSGGFRGWSPLFFLGMELRGKALGLVGGGRIGAEVARIAKAFGMRVAYWSRSASPAVERAGGRRASLARLLESSDVVSLHVPLSQSTRRLIGSRELARMKRTAVLVNTARGAVVDERALVKALRSKKIFAAGLDVYENEPRLVPGLAGVRNAVLCPHIGSATVESRAAMSVLAARNVIAVLRGRPPLTPVK